MLAVLIAGLLALAPTPTPSIGFEVPPEGYWETATVEIPATRGTTVQVETLPTPLPNTGIHGLPFAPEGLSNCDEMNFYRVQAGLPARFAVLGARESNCRNEDGVRTFCCYGYWQLYVSLHERSSVLGPLYRACGVYSAEDVNSDTPIDKQRMACATKALYDTNGYGPWR